MKQRVLLVNKFYYRRGGDCVYLLNLEEMLRGRGHEVAVYSMAFPENISSPWSGNFAGEVTFRGNMRDKLHAVERALGLGDINRSFTDMLSSFRPDVVHLNNIHSYLSPRLAQLAHRSGARVVWTLHDYKLVCPSYSCLCHGEVCERCFSGLSAVVKRRCMKGSLGASVIAWLEARKWNRKVIEESVDAFICPSQFMAEAMCRGGYSPSRMLTLNNFVAPESHALMSRRDPARRTSDYCCYVGRLSEEKGVATLLDAAAGQPFKLKVAGGGPLADELRRRYAGDCSIEFLGHLDAQGVAELLGNARFSVVPSEWYENNPFSIIESLCCGTPVVGAAIGGIPELLDSSNGILFASRDTAALRHAMEEAATREWDNVSIAAAALERFSPEAHYERLDKIYRGDFALS